MIDDDYTIANLKPSPMQLRVMEAYLRCGSQKQVAQELKISPQTVKNHMTNLYIRLGVKGAIEALHALGWVRAPSSIGTMPCGWLAYCGRAENHRGQHGGFRPFVKRQYKRME